MTMHLILLKLEGKYIHRAGADSNLSSLTVPDVTGIFKMPFTNSDQKVKEDSCYYAQASNVVLYPSVLDCLLELFSRAAVCSNSNTMTAIKAGRLINPVERLGYSERIDHRSRRSDRIGDHRLVCPSCPTARE